MQRSLSARHSAFVCPSSLAYCPRLIAAVIMADGEVHDLAAGCKIAVIHYEGNSRLAAQCFIIGLAKPIKISPSIFHVEAKPGSRGCRRWFLSSKSSLFSLASREGCIQGRHHEAVLQNPSLVLDMVVHDNTYDAGVIPRQQDTGHIGDVAGFFPTPARPVFTVASEILAVFPWITLETVAVLIPKASAMSAIRTRFCSMQYLLFYSSYSMVQHKRKILNG